MSPASIAVERAAPAPLRLAAPAGRWVVAAAVLGSGLASVDATVVNLALPALGRDLHADFAGLQWTINAYTLTLAALILLGGSLGDRFGRRKIFVLGTLWFAGTSAVCALAPTIELLVAARPPGSWRCPAHAWQSGHHRRLLRGPGPLQGHRRLVRSGWHRDRRRTVHRRLPRGRPGLALDLPDQRAARRRGHSHCAAPPA
jgi:hypothetical protein